MPSDGITNLPARQTQNVGPANATRISKRRAGAIVARNGGFDLEIWRLRKPSKDGLQRFRDVTLTVHCKTREAAEAALLIKIEEAKNRKTLDE